MPGPEAGHQAFRPPEEDQRSDENRSEKGQAPPCSQPDNRDPKEENDEGEIGGKEEKSLDGGAWLPGQWERQESVGTEHTDPKEQAVHPPERAPCAL